MRKLAEVEEANALMTEAMSWSVMKWLREKKRVRKIADLANAALDRFKKEVKANWSDDLKGAYQQSLAGKKEPALGPDLARFVKQIMQADDAARSARRDAEDTFDEAERQLSARLAREGCKKAMHQWELDEKAIAVAEAGVRSSKAVR